MSSEKISLQPQGYAEEEKEEEKSEPGGLQERLQEDSGCKKAGNQAHRTKTTCRDIFITVTNLLGFAFVNAAVSVIHPFYPIEVSFSYWGLCNSGGGRYFSVGELKRKLCTSHCYAPPAPGGAVGGDFSDFDC